jgi:Ca2+-binding RTX toxin-like protein
VLIAGGGNSTLTSYGANSTLVGGSGTNVLIGSGSGDVLVGGSGTTTLTAYGSGETLTAGSGVNTMIDSASNGIYQFGSTAGSTIIQNGASTNSSTSNELDFGAGISKENLWFLQVGNNLQIDVIGTNKTVTVANWFASPGNQLQEITAGGQKLDGEVSQLVQAMATYTAGHSGFDPTSVAQAPNDPTLQGAIGTAWHA